MKKILVIFITMCMVSSIVSCTRQEKNNEVEEIINSFAEEWNLGEIPAPQIKVVSLKEIQRMSRVTGSSATYNKEEKIIYIAREINEQYSKTLLAHEVLHYVNHYKSGFSENYGVDFIVKENVLGFFLTEGITEYFTESIFPMAEGWAMYPTETLFAEQLQIIYEAVGISMFDLFISSDKKEMQKQFDSIAYSAGLENAEAFSGIYLTPFEQVCMYLDISSKQLLAGNKRNFLYYAAIAENEIAVVCEYLGKEEEYIGTVEKYQEKYSNLLKIG